MINRLDRAYGNAKYLAPSFEHKNLVNIVGLRQGQKIWLPQQATNTGGRNRICSSSPHYLHETSLTKSYKEETRQVYQQSIFEISPTDEQQVCTITRKNRKLVHHIYSWKGLLLRSKSGNKMSDKPVNLVGMITKDADTGERIFQNPMFLVISGAYKSEITPQMAFEEYLRRYSTIF